MHELIRFHDTPTMSQSDRYREGLDPHDISRRVSIWVGASPTVIACTDDVMVTCEPRPMGKTRRGSIARYTYHRAGREQGRRYVHALLFLERPLTDAERATRWATICSGIVV